MPGRDLKALGERELAELGLKTLNRVAKWRKVFAGWQLGTRSKADPESKAVEDHREATILLRIEVTALTRILLEKGVCDQREITEAVIAEAEHYSTALEDKFPGMRAFDEGIEIYDVPRAAETTKGWKP